MKITALTSAASMTQLWRTRFFDTQYSKHVFMYAHTDEQLPKIVKETRSFVLLLNPVTLKAKKVLNIKTGISMMRKPAGSRITVSFNTLSVGIHNWDLCSTERLEYDDCDPNSALSIHCDNSWNEEDIQVGYIYISIVTGRVRCTK